MNECQVSEAFDPRLSGPRPQAHSYVALWDTGATGTVISQKVIDDCGLAPTGLIKAHGVDGEYQTETFLINIMLPNGVGLAGQRVTRGTFSTGEFDVLVGMDVMNNGDFAVTNYGGQTKFTFRVPSQGGIDFVTPQNHSRGVAPKRPNAGQQKPQPRRPKSGGRGKKGR